MKYTIKFPSKTIEKKFEKELDELSAEIIEALYDEIEKLADNPRPSGEPKLKPPIDVFSHTAQYRLRKGRFRVLYDVDDKKKIVYILALRKRNERTY